MTRRQTLARSFMAVAFSLSVAFTATAQMPSITGTVFHDIDLNGVFSTGEELIGVSVDLFQDDGDGIFSPTLDSIVTSATTDSSGIYDFTGLVPTNNYFVYRSAQTVNGTSLGDSVTGLLTVGGFNLLIDDFSNQQRVDANPGVLIGSDNLMANAIGGQRDLHVEYLSGPADSTLWSNPYGLSQVLEFNQSAAVTSVATVTWDGIDTDESTTPTAGGLGGIDLTQGGLNEAFAFTVGVDAAGLGENLKFRIFSESGVSEAVVALPITNGTATMNQQLPLSQFVGTADLTAVDAIQLELGGHNPSIDAQIGPLGLIGPSVGNISVAAVPEPSTLLLTMFAFVWFAGKSRRRVR